MQPAPPVSQWQAGFNGHHAEWQDNMQSFSNTEPAVDLTAASPLAFARQIAGLT